MVKVELNYDEIDKMSYSEIQHLIVLIEKRVEILKINQHANFDYISYLLELRLEILSYLDSKFKVLGNYEKNIL